MVYKISKSTLTKSADEIPCEKLPLTTKDRAYEHNQDRNSTTHNNVAGESNKNIRRKTSKKELQRCCKIIKNLFILLIICILLIFIGYLIFYFRLRTYEPAERNNAYDGKIINKLSANKPKIPDPVVQQKPSASTLHLFSNGAVCSDSDICSYVGRNTLQKGGNVIDAAIATLLCNGIVTLQSMGIGGGFLMNLYIKSEKKSWTIDAREVAPLFAKKDMFMHLPSHATIRGPLSIAVPGEIAGYAEVVKHFGTMQWKDLIEPSIQICKNGFKITRHMHDSFNINSFIKEDTHLRKTFVNNRTNEFQQIGTHVFPPKELCQTYRILAKEGPESFYKGSLSNLIAEDLRDLGSIITRDDLSIYHVDMVQSIAVEVDDDSIMYVIPPPGSGSLVSHILEILKGYNMTDQIVSDVKKNDLLYHRIVEAFKFAYAKRADLGDLRFNPDAIYLVSNLTSKLYGDKIRKLIDDNKTFDDLKHYGLNSVLGSDYGTSHLSLVAPNGDAVSVTSSVNFYFGSGRTGKRTGIIFNSGMDDFSKPDGISFFGLQPSKTNFIEPRKRALSSMSPTIITNKKGLVKLVVGAAGGTKIPSSVAQVIARTIWFKQDIKQAIDAPRLHHQLMPNVVDYEYGVLQNVIDGLSKRGHVVNRYRERGSVVCGIFKNDTAVYANADYRKEGAASGF